MIVGAAAFVTSYLQVISNKDLVSSGSSSLTDDYFLTFKEKLMSIEV